MMSTEQLTEVITCKNCENRFEGNFCPGCSQKADTHRFTLRHFAHEAFHALTHTDKGILFLIKKLLRWPGVVAREYVLGKRKKYFNPFTFFAITVAVSFFVVKKTVYYESVVKSSEEITNRFIDPSDKDIQVRSQQAMQQVRMQSAKLMENGKIVSFSFLPLLAFLTWVFFRKSGFNFVETLVMTLFAQGQSNLLNIFICILPSFIFPSLITPLLLLNILIMWAYFILVYRQFYQQGKLRTILKGGTVQVLYFLFVSSISQVLMIFL